jgi:hypothetical protein
MKKRLVVILLVIKVIVFASCDKYCTCTAENGGSPQSIEIEPNENCSDYSEGNMSCY